MRQTIMIVLSMILVLGCTQNQQGATDSVETDLGQDADGTAPSEPMKEDTKAPVDTLSGLKALFAKMPEYKVTYQTAGMQGAGQMTQYMKGTKIRSDSSYMGREMRTYIIDKQLTTCRNEGGSWTCMNLDAQQGTETGFDMQSNLEKYRTESLPERTVAGARTRCFRMYVEQGTTDYCYSDEGVPLYVRTESGEYMSEMTATSYSTSVSDSEFALPAEPSAMPTGMPQGLPEGIDFPEDMEFPTEFP